MKVSFLLATVLLAGCGADGLVIFHISLPDLDGGEKVEWVNVRTNVGTGAYFVEETETLGMWVRPGDVDGVGIGGTFRDNAVLAESGVFFAHVAAGATEHVSLTLLPIAPHTLRPDAGRRPDAGSPDASSPLDRPGDL